MKLISIGLIALLSGCSLSVGHNISLYAKVNVDIRIANKNNGLRFVHQNYNQLTTLPNSGCRGDIGFNYQF